MRSEDARNAFVRFLDYHGTDADLRDPVAAFRLACAFYETERVVDCDLEADRDMLLVQWGVYDFGDGPWFRFNLTRQFIPGLPSVDSPMESDFPIWQLSWTLFLSPSEALAALGKTNRWCNRPSRVSALVDELSGLPLLTVLATQRAEHTEMSYHNVD